MGGAKGGWAMRLTVCELVARLARLLAEHPEVAGCELTALVVEATILLGVFDDPDDPTQMLMLGKVTDLADCRAVACP